MHGTPTAAAAIAEAVRSARHAQGLRQDELALAAGVSVRSVHHVESGKPTVRLDVLERVLAALGLVIQVAPRHRPGGA